MTAELSVEFRSRRYDNAALGLEAFAEALSADWQRAVPALKRELDSYLKGVHASLAKGHAPGGGGGAGLASRSGKALQSIGQSIKVTGETMDSVEGRIGGLFYLRIHETGGTVRPKSGKYLTVPLPAARDASGRPAKNSAREWDKTFVLRSRNGNLIVARRAGRTVVPLYLLVRQVAIAPRLGLRQRLERGAAAFAERAMKSIAKEMRGG